MLTSVVIKMTDNDNFSGVFFRIYDKYVTRGEVSFSELKIPKIAFTNICMNPDYVFPDEVIINICKTLDLQGEELDSMMKYVKGED